MANLEAALKTVDSALKTGQIGTPVAVRIVAHVTADHGEIERLLARALDAAAGWLGSKPQSVTALGSVAGGQISTLMQMADGQTALISAGSSGIGSPLWEIVVFGNHGILSWEGDDGFTLTADDEQRQLSAQGSDLLRRVQQSLATRPKSSPPQTPSSEKRTPTSRPALKPPYGVLLVAGDHTHQPNYAEALAADKRCRLIGLTDEADVSARRKQLNEQLARTLDIPLLPDLRAALARDDVHVVSICAEPNRRGRIIVQAAAAGKHLYLDKPLAGSLRDADAIVTAVRKSGVLAHMFSLVQTDTAARVRQIVQSGRLGKLTAVHCDLCFAKGHGGTAKLGRPRRESPVPNQFELADAKRELTNVGVYNLVMLSWLLGRQVRSVSATTGNYFFSEHQQHDMEDFGQMLLELDGGLTATVTAGRTGWRSHPSTGLNRTYLIGTKATAAIDTHRPRVELWSDAEPWTAPPRNPDDPMGMWHTPPTSRYAASPKHSWLAPAAPPIADATHFLDCLQHGRESEIPIDIAAQATEVLLAAYQSAATGSIIPLPLPRD
jgi:predicted dehydrogenase